MALLRGINVGGNCRLPMKSLVRFFEDAGCADVRTYIQSGNVVFTASAARMGKLTAAIPAAIERRLGFRPPIVIRSANELAKVARGNPFLDEGCDPATLHVAFLAGTPDRAGVAALDPLRSPPSRFEVRGPHIFLHLPEGVANTRLTNDYFDRTLRTITTVRNWRTVTTLLEMTRAAG